MPFVVHHIRTKCFINGKWRETGYYPYNPDSLTLKLDMRFTDRRKCHAKCNELNELLLDMKAQEDFLNGIE